MEEHNQNLIQVLDRLCAAGLRLKPKKCCFAQLQVEYLGHVVSAEGISTDPKKSKAVREFPIPTSVKEVRGAVLAQRRDDGTVKLVAYASRSLQQHEKNYGITELEGLAVVWAAKHFRHYLYGHKCEVYTDHEALKALLNTPRPSGKLARWGMALQELDIEIFYQPGKVNSNADALSRSPLQEGVPSYCES